MVRDCWIHHWNSGSTASKPGATKLLASLRARALVAVLGILASYGVRRFFRHFPRAVSSDFAVAKSLDHKLLRSHLAGRKSDSPLIYSLLFGRSWAQVSRFTSRDGSNIQHGVVNRKQRSSLMRLGAASTRRVRCGTL